MHEKLQEPEPTAKRWTRLGINRLSGDAEHRPAGDGKTTVAAIVLFLGFCIGVLLGGCQPTPKQAAEAPPPTPTNTGTLYSSQPLSNLAVIKLWLGAEELSTEVCLTPQQLATGMMYRTNLAENAAMLFPFAAPHRTAFYMKNTTVPLSAAYIDPEGVILEIHDLKPLDETAVEAASDQVQYVLEVNQGWFRRHGISTGAVVRTAQGPLKRAFRMGGSQ